MTRKTRFILFLGLLVSYFFLAPLIVLYALGYNFDFLHKKVVTTGGFYAQIWPAQVDVLIGNKIAEKTGFFSNEIFVNNLEPQKYEIIVRKDGYYSWQKNLNVRSQEVTKAKNITLIKESLSFDKIDGNIDSFSISPDGQKIALIKQISGKTQFEVLETSTKASLGEGILSQEIPLPDAEIIWSDNSKILIQKSASEYFLFDYRVKIQNITTIKIDGNKISFNPFNAGEIFYVKNKTLYASNKPILNNLLDYKIYNNEIYWLKDNGFAYRADLSGKNIEVLNTEPLLANNSRQYKLFAFKDAIIVTENGNIFLLDKQIASFKNYGESADELIAAPDDSKILGLKTKDIFYFQTEDSAEKINLVKSQNKIDDCFWLNSDYIIYKMKNTIKISETDARDKINIVEISYNNASSNFKIYFNDMDKKLYILDNDNLFVSEQLTDIDNK